MFVQLEGRVSSIDGDGDGSNSGHSLLKSTFILGGDVGEASVCCTDGVLLESALVVRSFVRVGVFGVDTGVVLDVFEGLIHQTTVATHVALSSRAID